MKKILFFLLLPAALQSQTLYHTAGAQCGAHGSGGCRHYQSPCPPGANAEIALVLTTDQNGAQTSWQIEDETTASLAGQGDNLANNTAYHLRLCAFIDHCYHFRIDDSGGNGIAAPGGYSLYWNGDLLRRGGTFGNLDTVAWGGCCTGFSATLKGGKTCISNHYGLVFSEITGGTPPFQYQWSSGATQTQTYPLNASDADIAVTVTDAAGCTAGAGFSASGLVPLAVTVETTPVTAPNTGTAAVAINSGVPPFTYAWSNGGQTASLAGLPPGFFSVTVTDGSGCVATGAGQIIVSTNQAAPENMDFRCFPNPAGHGIHITFNARTDGKGNLQVVNARGAIVLRQDIVVLPGENYHYLNVEVLPAGQYWVGLQIGALRQFRGVLLGE